MQLHSPEELLRERFRCRESMKDCDSAADLSNDSGCFGFNHNGICDGQRSFEVAAAVLTENFCNHSGTARVYPVAQLDAAQMVNYLRFERYVADSEQNQVQFLTRNAVRYLDRKSVV